MNLICGTCKSELKDWYDDCPVCKEREEKQKQQDARPDYDLIFPQEKDKREHKEKNKK